MGEIANVPSPCKNNVEGVLQRNGLSYYNALMLATGVNRPIFNGGEAAVTSSQRRQRAGTFLCQLAISGSQHLGQHGGARSC